MNYLNKIYALLLALAMLLTLAACGNTGSTNDSTDGGVNTPATTQFTGDVVTAALPDGWCLTNGREVNGSVSIDYICNASSYQSDAPCMQVMDDSQSLGDLKAMLELESLYGTYMGSQKLANGTWYLAERAAVAQLGDKVIMVIGAGCDFGSEEVQSILGSLQWGN